VTGKSVAAWTQPLVLPALALVMTLSATNITSRDFTTIRAMPGTILISLLLNYVVMGGVTLLMAWWLVDDPEIWAGFVIIAAAPPAVAVVPFSYILGGNTLFSLVGMTGAYLAALGIMPLAAVLFLDVKFFNPIDLLLILGQLVILPIFISRLLLFTGWAGRIKRWRGSITNWSFFVVLFTIVGLNRQAFFGEFNTLLKITIIAIVISFILGEVIELVARAWRLNRETSISLILMGSMKNYGLASGIMLALFSERAAIPASICAVFGILRFIWLGFHFKK
jgi:BASS family bile acid:Na+ symporter